MKKILFIILVTIVLGVIATILLLFNKKESDVLPISDIPWTRISHDTETLRFGSDGSFWYSCSCGSPVDNSDICDTYFYDEDTKTITLKCIDVEDEIIKLVDYTDNTLTLEFEDGIREFTKK